jgi:hypothetical protein
VSTPKQESFTSWVVEASFFNDLRTLAVAGEFNTPLTTLLILQTWNELYRRRSHRLSKAIWIGLAMSIGLEASIASAVLNRLCSADIDYLFLDENGEIGSKSVDERCATRSEERKVWREKKRGQRANKQDVQQESVGTSSTIERVVPTLSPGDSPTPTPTPTPHINNNNGAPDFSHFEADERENLERVNAMLEPPDHPRVLKSSHLGTGRRPTKKYSEIWLDPFELKEVFQALESSGLPPESFSAVFKAVQSHIKTKVGSGAMAERFNAYTALTGWALREQLENERNKIDLIRSNNYLNKSVGA